LNPRSADLNNDELITYYNVVVGLNEIYSRKENKAKTDELKPKIAELKQRISAASRR
jgi:hypothetical protein